MTPADVVRAFYDAINAGDIVAAVALLHPDIVRVEFDADEYRGVDAVRAHFAQARATWAEGACTPARIDVEGDTVTVDVHVRVRLRDRPDWIEGRVRDVFVFRDAKIAEFRSFAG